ncbi:MAG TPA: hypothetical protein VLU25_03870 [Acidobacteriota bacterium]|nr:hypothetical protein [Acidobacteriota bacterium]
MARWDDAGRGLRERAEARLRRRAGRMPLRQRLEVSMALLWGGALAVMGLSVLALLVVAELGQWSAQPGLRPLADARILENLRTSSQEPFVDAVWQAEEERLYVGQQDWTFHRFDPDTRLWSTERPLETADPGGGSPLALLDAGCGGLAAGCPEPSALYALSERGGLLRRRPAFLSSSLWASPWQVLMGDNAFVGASGAPVEQDSLSAAAVSPDGRLLALGSSDGVGLYDTRGRRWLDNSALNQALDEKDITHLAFWRGRLWIGNRQGLTPLDHDSDPPALLVDERLNGRVLDLDVESAPGADRNRGPLWLLQERRCLSGQSAPAPPPASPAAASPSAQGQESQDAAAFPDQPAGGCLRLARLDDPVRPPVLLVDESARFPALNLDDLHFAVQRDDLLVVAGRAGIYAYDLRRRSWKGLFPRSVTSLLPLPGNSGFYFGYTGGVGIESGGEITTWPLGEDAEITVLRFGDGAEVLALAGNGSLFAFNGVDAPVTLRRSSRSALADPQADPGTSIEIPFEDAVGLLDAVFLAGQRGALLHNVVTRRYVDIPADQVPGWMRTPGRRFFASDRYLYVLAPQRPGRTTAYILPRYRIEEGDLESYLPPVELTAPVDPLRDWDGRGLGLIDAAGNALRLHPGGSERFNGDAQPGLDGLPLLDAAAQGPLLTLATSAGLQTYDTSARSWSGFVDPPLQTSARQVAYYNDQLLVLHSDGRLGRTTSTAHVIGDARGFSISDQGVSDVHPRGRLLYLAGEGAVEAYDPLLRRIIARWRLSSGGDVEVLGLAGNRPVSLNRGVLYRGDERLESGAGRVVRASLEDGRLWMQVEQQGVHFLRTQGSADPSPATPAQCYFRRPSAGPEVSRLLDAARLADGSVAVATDAGVRFYDPALRSWTDPPLQLRDFPAQRVRTVGRRLLAWRDESTGSGLRLAILSRDALQWPDSCSDGPAVLPPGDSVEWRRPLDLAFSPGGDQAAWLLADQSVEVLSRGRVRRLLDPPGGAPPWDQLQAVYDRSQAPVPYLLLAQEAAPRQDGPQPTLWLYRLDRRSWHPIQLSGLAGEGMAHLNLVRDATSEVATLRGSGGSFYRSVFQPLTMGGDGPRAAPLRLLYAPAPPLRQAAPPLDVQGSGNLWTFVLPGGVFHYNALQRRWLPDALRLPAADPSLQLRRVDGRLIAVADSGNSWYVADDESDTPLSWTRRQGPGTSAGLETPAALVTDWMRWDRAGGRFMLSTPEGPRELPASQSLDASGRYFFEQVEAVLAPDAGTLWAANAYGLWMHAQPQLGLGDAGVAFRPANLGLPMRAEGGRIVGSSQAFDPASQEIQTLDAGTQDAATYAGDSPEVALGQLILSTDRASSGLVLRPARGAPLDLARGFPWDARRRRVAYDGSGNLVLLTEGGPQPAQGLAPVSSPPRRRPEGVLLADDTWTWSRGGGQADALEIRTVDGRLLRHGQSPDGVYSFQADRLSDSAFHQGTLWLLSSAGLQRTARPATGMRWQNVEEAGLSEVERLLQPRTPQGRVLAALAGDSLRQWDGEWRSPSTALLSGLMVEAPRLRFQRARGTEGGAGRGIVKLLRVENAAGVGGWVPFQWHRGRFPFDVITSMTALGRRLLLGSQAGLQVYSGYADDGLDAIDHIYSLGRHPEQGLRVQRLAVSPQDPSTAIADGDGFCLALPTRGQPRPCDQSVPAESLRADTPLWRWTASGGRVQGRYKLESASGGSNVISIRAGRLPHDRLRDLASFDSQSFFLWDDGRVSLHPRGGGRLQDMRLFSGFPSTPLGFALVEKQPAEDPPTLAGGLYLRLDDGGALHWQPGPESWRPLDPDRAARLDLYLRTRPIFRQGRLRLVHADARQSPRRSSAAGSTLGPFRFDYRTPGGTWRPLGWQGGRLQIDIWNDFVSYGGQTWAATPAGLAAFRRGAGQVVLDPSSFRLIPGPLDAEGNLLPVTDMQSDGPALVLRCNSDSDRLFLVNLDLLDDGRVFTPLQGDDPFAQQTLVQTDYWQWRLQGRRDGSPGVLRFTFKERESDLSAGRFDFDTLTSLALFGDAHIETATQSGGWLRYPRLLEADRQAPGTFHPANLIRPRETAFDPVNIRRLHLGRALDQEALCLIDAQGRSWRLLPETEPSQVASCPAHLAQDSLWSYSLTPSGLQAETDAIPFPVQRRLTAGRFQDAIALTPPRPLNASDNSSASPARALDLPETTRYLLLTPSGILALDANLAATSLITPDWPNYTLLSESLSRTPTFPVPPIPNLPPNFTPLRTIPTPTHLYLLTQSDLLEFSPSPH